MDPDPWIHLLGIVDPDPRIHLSGIVDPDPGPEWIWIQVLKFGFFFSSLKQTTYNLPGYDLYTNV